MARTNKVYENVRHNPGRTQYTDKDQEAARGRQTDYLGLGVLAEAADQKKSLEPSLNVPWVV